LKFRSETDCKDKKDFSIAQIFFKIFFTLHRFLSAFEFKTTFGFMPKTRSEFRISKNPYLCFAGAKVTAFFLSANILQSFFYIFSIFFRLKPHTLIYKNSEMELAAYSKTDLKT